MRREKGFELFRCKKVYSSICRLLNNLMAEQKGFELSKRCNDKYSLNEYAV